MLQARCPTAGHSGIQYNLNNCCLRIVIICVGVIEHLSTYALRRVLTIDDQEDLRAIEVEAKRNDYRIKDVIRAVAVSNLLLQLAHDCYKETRTKNQIL